MASEARYAAIGSYVEGMKPDLYGAFWMRRRIEEEVMAHLEEAVDRLKEEGLSDEEAEARAVASFGSPEIVARSFATSKGVGVPTNFTRWAGIAAILGAAVIGAAQVVQNLSESFRYGPFAEVSGLGGILFAIGVIGMYLRMRGQLGRFGRVGFRLMVGGFVASLASSFVWFTPGGVAGFVVMLGGVAVYVMGMYRADIFPKGAVLLLGAGTLLTLFAVVTGVAGLIVDTDTGVAAAIAGAIPLAVAIAWIGGYMWRESPYHSNVDDDALPA